MAIDLSQTIEQVENDYWPDPGYDSYLVTTCHLLRKKPLKDFTTEDLRILIGQNISLDILIPLTMEKLQQNIMAEGDLYPGDLLKSVLSADSEYWLKNPVLHRKLGKLYRNNLPSMEKMVGRSITKGIFKGLTESFDTFSKIAF
ncbi:MAG: contact-dependent growth inhibition system immunity protein [Chitinophagaceae bacterium]